MEHTVEMGSGAMIYIPNFRHSEVNREDSQTAWRWHNPAFIFSK
jgi:uncharacterized RmlC-like cupin family protein